MSEPEQEFEYIVVGSGPGGGTLAARLAENGFRVLLLEAGGDPLKEEGGNPNPYTGNNTLPEDYQVPAFHAQASENSGMKWDFYVRHYSDTAMQQKDPKYVAAEDGILYPRNAGLGGCSAHNAMITVYPHNADWDEIATLTGDKSWRADAMRKYFMLLENCHHRPWWRFWSWLGFNPTRHGFKGWLHTECAIPEAVLDDKNMMTAIIDSTVAEALGKNTTSFWERVRWFLLGRGDPNDWRLVRENSCGVRYLPLATNKHKRMGSRERVLEVAAKHPDHLTVRTHAFVTRVIFEGKRAVGVAYLQGAARNETCEVRASREVILCGGTFSTPQLLMLSGIGPAGDLREHGIDVLVDSPGVGQNLQDRYEVGVVYRMNFKEWWVLKGARFHVGDPQYLAWQKGEGVYITNGVISSVFLKSFEERPLPDLFCFAIIGPFRGYYPGYSREFAEHRNYLTWSILKAHTNNNAGWVRLRSKDPLQPPEINFRYFGEGSDTKGEDLDSMVKGVKYVRRLTAGLQTKNLIRSEEVPGPGVQTDAQIAEFVETNAWGHHASGTCAIGSVTDSEFRVLGVDGLRVVDASVFPKIPGFFIASSVYMIGEKAADIITRDARK
jgi:choline dehydrogenase-like flavoprotein